MFFFARPVGSFLFFFVIKCGVLVCVRVLIPPMWCVCACLICVFFHRRRGEVFCLFVVFSSCVLLVWHGLFVVLVVFVFCAISFYSLYGSSCLPCVRVCLFYLVMFVFLFSLFFLLLRRACRLVFFSACLVILCVCSLSDFAGCFFCFYAYGRIGMRSNEKKWWQVRKRRCWCVLVSCLSIGMRTVNGYAGGVWWLSGRVVVLCVF